MGAARILGSGGWTLLDVVMFVCFAAGTPWTVLGFWNSVIGVWLLHWHKNPLAEVAPFAAAGDVPTPITIETAILMTVRNEDPARAILRLKTVKASVDATGEGAAFSYFILSDTNDAAVAAAEEKAVAAWKAAGPRTAIASPIAAAPTTRATRPATCATSASGGATSTS